MRSTRWRNFTGLDIRLFEVTSFSAEDVPSPRRDLREDTGDGGEHVEGDDKEENSDTTNEEEDSRECLENDDGSLREDTVKEGLHSRNVGHKHMLK